MGYYDQTDIPFLYGAANAFAISDRYFCSLLGPTYPNREFLYAGTSFGYTYNALLADPLPNMIESLETAGVRWRVYSETYPGPAIFLHTYTRDPLRDHFELLPNFFDAARDGLLPSVVFVDPNLRDDGAARDDLHPPGDVQLGDQFLEKVVRAAMASPQWPHLALFITFDEHGGLYDHVPPPAACPPDNKPPKFEPGHPASPGLFDRYGFRVPLIVVSPWARPHFVSHVVRDHGAILRFVEARFILQALTARDANAEPPYDLFDFSRAALAAPPELPAAKLDPAKLAACEAMFPNPNARRDGGAPVDAGARD